MSLVDASQQALLQASIKDDFYLQILRSQVSYFAQQIFGAKLWLAWKKELEIVSDIIYFALTTIKGSQTLGEEYASIIQVDSSKRKIPSKIQRTLYVLLKSTSPYFLEKSLGKLQQKIEASKDFSSLLKKRLIVLLKLIQQLSPVLQKLHLLVFFLDGLYSTIALRISKIKHILIRPYNENESDPSTFHWLAIMLGVQVIISLQTVLRSVKQEMKEAASREQEVDPGEENDILLHHRIHTKCILCLENIENASTTICGHLFCWKCIVDWCTVKPECPSCREKCPPSRIVMLHHYIPNNV